MIGVSIVIGVVVDVPWLLERHIVVPIAMSIVVVVCVACVVARWPICWLVVE